VVKEFWTYTAARVGLFLFCYGAIVGVCVLVAGTPVPLLWPLVAAALISSLLSLVLLSGLRARFNDSVQARAERMSRRLEESRAKEDVD
jgi:membrane protein implicated in regulation of membrane protease activity